jgi:hypothetical protein
MVLEVDTVEIERHIVPNIYGFIWLYQAFHALIIKAEKPKWVTIEPSATFLT